MLEQTHSICRNDLDYLFQQNFFPSLWEKDILPVVDAGPNLIFNLLKSPIPVSTHNQRQTKVLLLIRAMGNSCSREDLSLTVLSVLELKKIPILSLFTP